MFHRSKPTTHEIEAFIEKAHESELSYNAVGTTKNEGPHAGCNVDHNSIRLGQGDTDWESAKQAIREWRMFDFDWVEIFSKNTPIETGQTVAVLIRHFGFYSLNAARIVYTIDEPGRFGFAYGTLEDHGESGEERFMVERDADGKVWYDLKALSKPNHILAKLGYPFIRMLQKAFAEDSKQAMQRWTKRQG